LRLHPAEFAAHAADLALLARKHTLMLQPYLPEVEADGEWSLLYFDGEFSHAVRKRPKAGDFRVQEKHGGGHERAEPGPELVAQGRTVLAALPGLGFDTCLYARVDGVVSGGRLLLMELEVLEPQLFLAGAPHAGATFARLLSSHLVQRAARVGSD
jgi:glutathione synthase/RimK-type ligase-like ATP-grasp enzyme